MRNYKLLKQLSRELEHLVKCSCNQSCTLDDIANTLKNVRKRAKKGAKVSERNILSGLNEDSHRERVAKVINKKNSCHNCGLTDHYSNNCPKEKLKVYAIEQVQEEEIKEEDLKSDSITRANVASISGN
ncbi:hypothetical protein O181_052460 [Austropuccinia psidii MF-1]|uniref:CCHC-type domain-containing protein n=1 Tax=Austropuccinia psidii MF-1 TaxID=1389203 RepID=A0A9Q3DYW9_9BASI|nr:hypothetical protein [Austropuccinia psidii MF-1]